MSAQKLADFAVALGPVQCVFRVDIPESIAVTSEFLRDNDNLSRDFVFADGSIGFRAFESVFEPIVEGQDVGNLLVEVERLQRHLARLSRGEFDLTGEFVAGSVSAVVRDYYRVTLGGGEAVLAPSTYNRLVTCIPFQSRRSLFAIYSIDGRHFGEIDLEKGETPMAYCTWCFEFDARYALSSVDEVGLAIRKAIEKERTADS